MSQKHLRVQHLGSDLPRFQALCERHGFRLTCLVNYEMAISSVFRQLGQDLLARRAAESGMHLHAWNSPPLLPLTADDLWHEPYLAEYLVDCSAIPHVSWRDKTGDPKGHGGSDAGPALAARVGNGLGRERRVAANATSVAGTRRCADQLLLEGRVSPTADDTTVKRTRASQSARLRLRQPRPGRSSGRRLPPKGVS